MIDSLLRDSKWPWYSKSRPKKNGHEEGEILDNSNVHEEEGNLPPNNGQSAMEDNFEWYDMIDERVLALQRRS